MKHASPQIVFDYLKKLADVEDDCELAKKIGYSKQAISGARSRGRVSMKLLGAASLALNKPIAEMEKEICLIQSTNSVNESGLCKEAVNQTASMSDFPDYGHPLWISWQETIKENAKLHREKEELLRENGELKAENALLKERLKAVNRGGEDYLEGTRTSAANQ